MCINKLEVQLLDQKIEIFLTKAPFEVRNVDYCHTVRQKQKFSRICPKKFIFSSPLPMILHVPQSDPNLLSPSHPAKNIKRLGTNDYWRAVFKMAADW